MSGDLSIFKMIALITGSKGFVGPYLKDELEKNKYKVFGIDITGENTNDYFVCDIREHDSLNKIIKKITPDVVFHLAGYSSVSKSFENPELCYSINVNGTRNLLDVIKESNIATKFILISSSEIYGKPKYLPVDEKHPTDPLSPYSKARLLQEQMLKEYNIPYIIIRAFNHTGAGQTDTFVIPSFKKQIEAAEGDGTIYVGNIDVIRDFSDVKDVVKAYRLLSEKGKIGEIYNVGSGYGYKLKDIIETLIKQSGKKLTISIDENKYRPAEIVEMICNNRKAYELTQFKFRKIF